MQLLSHSPALILILILFLLVKLLFPQLLTESEHPPLSVGRTDIEARVEANQAPVPGVEVVAIVVVFDTPDEPEGHLEADVGLIVLFESEVVLVAQIVPFRKNIMIQIITKAA